MFWVSRSHIIRHICSRAAAVIADRNPLRTWTLFSCVCFVCRDLFDELITRSEESYRVYVYVFMCDLETSTVRRPGPKLGCCLKEIGEKQEYHNYFLTSSCYGKGKSILLQARGAPRVPGS